MLTTCRYKDVEMGDVSSFVLHFDVDADGPAAFRGNRMKFASQDVEDLIMRKSANLPLSSVVSRLIQIDNGNKEYQHLETVLYEKVHLQV